MKKKIMIILSTIIVFLLGGFAVYAAFTFGIKAKIETQSFNLLESTDHQSFTIKKDNISVDSINMTFQNPMDFYDYQFTFTNNDQKIVRYETQLGPIDSADTFESDEAKKQMLSTIEGQILVFLDNVFIGTLSDLKEKNFLPAEQVVLPSESLEYHVKFELHNAVMLEKDLNITFGIKATVYTADVQQYSAVNNASQLIENLTAVEVGLSKTLILTGDITVADVYEINKSFTVDLNGHSLDIKWKILSSAKVKIIDSKTTGQIKGNVELSSTDAFLNVEADQSLNATLTSFCYDDLAKCVEDNIAKQDWITSGSTEEFDIFNHNKFYLNAVTLTSTNGNLQNGVLTQSTVLPKTIVCRLTMSYQGVDKAYDIKILGEGTDAVLESIIADELAHIRYYEVKTNPDEQVYLSADLFLPTVLKKYNCTIEWESSNKSLIKNNGVVQTGADGEVTLHARIKINDVLYERDFTIYIAKETNEQKLARLLSKINITFNEILPNPNNPEKGICSNYDLPSASNYLTWLNGEDLGISSLTYMVDSVYDYLSLDGYNLGLSKLTFDRDAEISVVAQFSSGNSDEESGTIHIKINLTANDALLNEILSIVQDQLNEVNVLQNLLNTRTGGLSLEKGDFSLINEYKGFVISYKTPTLDNELYSGEYVISDNNIIIHPEKFKTSEANATIIVCISADGTDAHEMTATFEVPGAIHLSNMGNNEVLFYSIKMQVLNQVTNLKVPSSLSGMKSIFAEAEHNDYILIDDILKCHALVIQASSDTSITLDYQDVSEIVTLIEWATSNTISSMTSLTIKDEHQWIKSDGLEAISDAEELLILGYCNKFPHFEAFWNDLFYKNIEVDNVLTDSEKTKLEAILLDENLSLLVEWATNNDGNNQLLMSISGITISELVDHPTSQPLADIIGNYSSDGLETISNIEEEAILRYCLTKGYTEFIAAWKTYITRQDNELTNMYNYSIVQFLYGDSSNTNTVAEIVFNDLCSFMSTTEDKTLADYVTAEGIRAFYGLDGNATTEYSGSWFKRDSLGTKEKEILKAFFVNNHFMTEQEWSTGYNGSSFETADVIGDIKETLRPYLTKGKSESRSDFEKIVEWAIGAHRLTFSSLGIALPEGMDVESPFNSIISDGKSTISYPEYQIIYQYLVNIYCDSTKFANTDQSQAFVEKILDLFLNLDFNNPFLTAEARTDLLSKIAGGIDEYQALISNAISLNSSLNLPFDGLPTISQAEYDQIKSFVQTNYPEQYDRYLTFLNQYILPTNREIKTLTDFDAYFNSIKIKDINGTAFDQFDYFTTPQFDNVDFTWLVYFNNLREFHLLGKEGLPAFKSSSVADQVLTYAIRYCPNLEVLDMKYTNLSDISILAYGQNLKVIALRGNDQIRELASLVSIPEGQIEYLNIVDVFAESEFRLSEAVLNKLYLSYVSIHGTAPRLVYRHNSKVAYYKPTMAQADGYDYLFLLKDIDTIDYTYHQLIKQVTVSETSHPITWEVVSGPISIQTTNTGAIRIVRNSQAASNAIITASVTVGGTKYTRYFDIVLSDMGGATS